MEHKDKEHGKEEGSKGGCCSHGGCKCCCAGKVLIAIFLLLLGGLGGYFVGRSCGSYKTGCAWHSHNLPEGHPPAQSAK